jgi:nucleoside transporter
MSDAAAKTDPAVKMKLFIMMIVELFVWGAWQPKVYNYMGQLGFVGWQQSLAGSVFGIASLLGIFFSNQFADRNFAAERFLAFSHFVGGLALIGVSQCEAIAARLQVEAYWPFFTLFLVYAILYVPTLSVTNALAFANLRDPANEFGFVRMGGTIGWIVASWPFVFLLSGISDPVELKNATSWIFIVAGIASFAMAAYSLTLPHTPPNKEAHGLDRLAWIRAAKLLAVPYVFVLFLVTLIDSTIHNGYFVLSDTFLTTRVGISDNMSMVVMSIGQVAEIVTMVVLGAVLARLGWKWTMVVGILGHAVRFGVFAFFADMQGVIIAIQILHGICYAFFFATVYIFVDAVFPKDVRTSAQGLFNLLILGVGGVIANFLFVPLRDYYTTAGVVDYQSLFLIPTGMAIVAIVVLAVFFQPPTDEAKLDGASAPAH